MKIVLRTDASLEIGTGHVMRCLTLANALRERGADCRFVCREHPGNLIELIRESGFEAYALPLQAEAEQAEGRSGKDLPGHADWVGAGWKADAEAVSSKIGEQKVDWLIVDHYGLDARWECALRPYCRKLMVIDDLADREHDCDLLLDQNLVADMAKRYDQKLPASCGKMLGPDYALLQREYAKLHPRTSLREGAVKRILVYFGGADTNNTTGMVIAAFLSLGCTGVAMDVVVNPDMPCSDEIRKQVDGQPNITIHTKLPSLASLMVQADLAIGAGGATSWERCCLGLPSLVVTLAENQKAIAAELDRLNVIRWLGHYKDVTQDRIVCALRDILAVGVDPAWSASCSRLVDGQGASRVSGYVVANSGTRLVARLAGRTDESLFLEWANDPLTRANSFDSREIDPETHRAWFSAQIENPDGCRMYVVETDEGLPVGQVRFTRVGNEWEIHYGLDARCRRRSLGSPLLATALKATKAAKKGAAFAYFGRVKPDNLPSREIFRQLGFSEELDGDELIYRQVSV